MNDEPDVFVALRMTGARFEESGIPVEALSELVAYRDLVIEVAKDVFRRNHPHRQRVPRGFDDRFALRLLRVDNGSATPVLQRLQSDPAALFSEADEFDAARDLVSEVIVSASRDEEVPDDFPNDVLTFFNRFGQSLRTGETIEVARRPDAPADAVYTPSVRRRLVLRNQDSYQSEGEVTGWVTEVDADRGQFHIRTSEQELRAPLDTVLFDSVKQALNRSGEEE